MKTRNLMIGDWVWLPAYRICARVRSIGEPYLDGHRQLTLDGEFGGIYSSISDESVQLLALTQQRLKAAGFTLPVANCDGLAHKTMPQLVVTETSNYFVVNFQMAESTGTQLRCSVVFVHELQHIMRMLGMNGDIKISM